MRYAWVHQTRNYLHKKVNKLVYKNLEFSARVRTIVDRLKSILKQPGVVHDHLKRLKLLYIYPYCTFPL